MANVLKQSKCWEYPPIPTVKENDMKEEDDNDDTSDKIAISDFEAADNSQNQNEVSSGISLKEKVSIVKKII